jgi:hypothetical protein
MTRLALIASMLVALASGASLAANLPPGDATAWFEDRQVTIAVAGTFGDPAADSTTHVVYTSSVTLPGAGEEPFMPVLETLPGRDDEFTSWAEVDIAFTAGTPPRQFTSADDVLAAMAAGEILLTPTGTRYALTLIDAGSDSPPGNRQVPGDILKPLTGSAPVTWGYVKSRDH